jgi:hypothetical protein
MVFANTALIFSEGDVKEPVETVFNMPMVACHGDGLLSFDGEGSDVIFDATMILIHLSNNKRRS